MTGIVRGGKVAFVPKARLLKLIGGELIRDDVMALIEIVKNSHDADASRVRVTFRGAVTGSGEITIEDDGTGMSVDDLLKHWMQPAGSSKRDPSAKRTRRGRRVLGEKGVGRFAVDRLGRYCELVSRKPRSKTEVVARFDWDAFDCDTTLLSEVMAEWEERAATTIKKKGTYLRIHGLRQPWTNRTFRRLTSRMQRLLSPYSRDDSFSVEILSDDLPDYSGEVKQPYLDLAPYRVRAEFDGNETISYQFNGNRSKTTWPGPGSLTCGPVTMTFSIFDLETDSVRRVGPVQDVRAWLREWSGVSIYRDGFRVLPYGEPDDDWLRLDQRRVNNPVQRLSNNQICAMIEISSDTNAELRDQTNRGGLIQNRAFEDLRRLVLHVLEIAESARQEIRNPKESGSDRMARTSPGDSVDSLLRSLRQQAARISRKSGFQLVPVLEALSEAYKREKEEQERTLSVHTELSAVGHNASFLATILAPDLRSIEEEIEEISREDPEGAEKLLYLQERVKQMQEGLDLLAPLSSSISGSERNIDLSREILDFAEVAARVAAHEQATIDEISIPDPLLLIDGQRDHLWQVLTILLRNSLQAMSRAKDRRIRIVVATPARSRDAVIYFRDKGHGIPEKIEGQIFEPGFTTRPGAKGMGLALAKAIVARMGGQIEVSRKYERYGWKSLKVTLPLARIS